MRSALVMALLLTACKLPLPYSAQALADSSTPRALVHYLSQEGVDLAVCDPAGSGPHLARQDAAMVDALMKSLEHDAIGVENWRGCLRNLWAGGVPETRLRIAEATLRTGANLLVRGAPDDVRALAIVEVIEGRPDDAEIPEATARQALEQVRAAGESSDLAVRFEREVELALGQWQGTPLTAERIQGMHDDEVLVRLATRVPSADLQRAAQARIVDLRIERSPYAILREHREEVREATLGTGFWALPEDIAVGAPAWATARGARIEGDGALRLIGASDSDRIPLDELLRFEVEGVGAVTTCTRRAPLTPLPCVGVDRLSLGSDALRLEGEVVVLGPIPPDAVLALADASTLVVPLSLDGRSTPLALPLELAPPEPVLFVGEPGEHGPALVVRVSLSQTGKVLFDVRQGLKHRAVAVLRPEHAKDFSVTSRGGPGLPGRPGTAGRAGPAGEAGLDAQCPTARGTNGFPGEDGEAGGDGGNGGPGGEGGTIKVYVTCASANECGDLIDLVEQTVSSEGGAGGPGGVGGKGGPGGPGGQGGKQENCTVSNTQSGSALPTFLEGGVNAPEGLRGKDGEPGQDGADGATGQVTIQVLK